MQIDDGDLWSFMRDVLSQGGDILSDFRGGKYKCYEEYSARLDAAARERVTKFRALEEPSTSAGAAPK